MDLSRALKLNPFYTYAPETNKATRDMQERECAPYSCTVQAVGATGGRFEDAEFACRLVACSRGKYEAFATALLNPLIVTSVLDGVFKSRNLPMVWTQETRPPYKGPVLIEWSLDSSMWQLRCETILPPGKGSQGFREAWLAGELPYIRLLLHYDMWKQRVFYLVPPGDVFTCHNESNAHRVHRVHRITEGEAGDPGFEEILRLEYANAVRDNALRGVSSHGPKSVIGFNRMEIRTTGGSEYDLTTFVKYWLSPFQFNSERDNSPFQFNSERDTKFFKKLATNIVEFPEFKTYVWIHGDEGSRCNEAAELRNKVQLLSSEYMASLIIKATRRGLHVRSQTREERKSSRSRTRSPSRHDRSQTRNIRKGSRSRTRSPRGDRKGSSTDMVV